MEIVIGDIVKLKDGIFFEVKECNKFIDIIVLVGYMGHFEISYKDVKDVYSLRKDLR